MLSTWKAPLEFSTWLSLATSSTPSVPPPSKFLSDFVTGLVFFLSNIAPNIDAAVGALMAYNGTLVLGCGFFIRLDDMPDYIAWYSKISFMRYSFGAMMMNHWESSDEAKALRVPSGGDPLLPSKPEGP